MVGQVPDSIMNQAKRDASTEATGRPNSQRQKASDGVHVAGPQRDVASVQSNASVVPDAAEVQAGISALEAAAKITAQGDVEPASQPVSQQARSSDFQPEWDGWARSKGLGKGGHVSQSRPKHTNLPNKSTQAVTLQTETLDLLLTLALQSSRRLNDLEATNYYTHTIPTASDMCLYIDQKYQAYLVVAQKDKDHTMGPPAIHRGIALLKKIMECKEQLEDKNGLNAMWPLVQAALNELADPDGDLCEAQSIVGHCKIAHMYDKSCTRLTFTFPQIVTCGNKTTTLGSVVSRLLRSIGYQRKIGVAPEGYLNRKLSDTLNTLREK
jgi:hypothetical protein